MTKRGQDVNGIARTEADHHMKCPACGQWFDMRDLGQVAGHIHDASEVEVAERPSPVYERRPPTEVA
jgi:CRISPR/Cas system type I-B associated protein Csh2 (Cas7 group RAMP superfamily)